MRWLPGNSVFALAAAVLWGIGDFSGGMGVKRAGGSIHAALRILLLSHGASLLVLLMLLGARGDAMPGGQLLWWGLAAGVAGGLSLTAFYVALSRGAMGASAAVSGLLAAAIPATFSSVLEGSPGPLRIAGFLTAGLAIWLIAATPTTSTLPTAHGGGTMLLAIAAGAGFGAYFIALRMAGPGGVLWPMALARVGSLCTCGGLLLALLTTGQAQAGSSSINRAAILWALLTAAGDTSGNLLFIAATRAGRLDIAAVLASLYPASTILLAGALLKERLTLRQGWGMAVAAAAVVLVTL